MCDHQFCLFFKVHATSDDIDPDRIAREEGRGHKGLFEPRANAAHRVFYGESGEVIRNLDGIYGEGRWVEGRFRRDVGVGVTLGGLGRLRDEEHVTHMVEVVGRIALWVWKSLNSVGYGSRPHQGCRMCRTKLAL